MLFINGSVMISNQLSKQAVSAMNNVNKCLGESTVYYGCDFT